MGLAQTARSEEEQTTDRYKQSKYIQKFISEKKRENSRRRRDPEWQLSNNSGGKDRKDPSGIYP